MKAGILLLLAAGSALAQPLQVPPRTRPARNVVVTYRIEGEATELVPGGIPGPVKLSWDAAGQRVRAEAEGRTQLALLDLDARTGQAVDTALRIALPFKITAADLQPLTLEGVHLVVQGRAMIAGFACTDYAIRAPKLAGTVCLTPDGVPLRARGTVRGKPGSLEALTVRYGPLPRTLFEIPAGTVSLDQPGALAAILGRAR